ncbi:hypothetical protein ACMD2_15468 [Ananas comosus]|uniref:Uncharacterized protein n=1 Tax=Ananas comosus TaxID=4615 RepID=A0A199W4S5_ANACO|nr:hypothetical protein ACMD2_15468 [Ananas comosus]
MRWLLAGRPIHCPSPIPSNSSINPSKKSGSKPSPLFGPSVVLLISASFRFPVDDSSPTAGKWPSNRARCPKSLSFREKLVPQEHSHGVSPQCLRWLLRSASTEKLFLLQRWHAYIFGQWLRLKWFLTHTADLRGRKRRWARLRLHPGKGHENRTDAAAFPFCIVDASPTSSELAPAVRAQAKPHVSISLPLSVKIYLYP